ncbi:MAG TPA: T9SS type A sorting domain-containing protein [Ignavibacteria bacterium]|nr:T9SS type A sorting domain-containing protein [Ignavibacteria bacterium]HMR39925.1 T9SS type A sorting domain-containing protein [Ignavibacteria bacterium]
MKKLKYLPIVIISAFVLYALGFSIMEGGFTNVTLQEIQFKPSDSLALGRDKSNLLDDSVSFVARVVAPPRVSPANNDFRTMMRGSNSWTCYVQDTANGVFGGIVIRQGSRGPQTAIDLLDTGAIIRVQGVIQEFGSTASNNYANTLTQLALDTANGYTVSILGNSPKRPDPKQVQITDFAIGDYPNGGTINYVDGEKYEGMYVEIRNVTTAAGIGNRQPFSIVDENGNRMYMRDFSNWFSASPSGDTLRPWTAPSIGTFVNSIRGVIINANNEGAFGTQLPYVIVPIYPNDLSLGNATPILSSPIRNPGVPTPSDSVTVTVTATDPGDSPVTIQNMSVLYRFNGGAFTSKNMDLVAGNIYSTKMPPASLGTTVEYFIRAEDNQNGIKLLPSDTSRSKLFYIVRTNDSMSIQDVQYCPNNGGRSAYEGYDVRGLEGIVTADTSDIPGINFTSSAGNQTSPRRVYIQNGTGEYSGIWVAGGPTDALRKGDKVRVKGTVEENFGCTRINIVTPSNIVLISSGNTQPPAEILSTGQIPNSAQDGDIEVEKWESVYIRFNTEVDINCINAGTGISCTTSEPLIDTVFRRNYGEILVADGSEIDARIELQDGNHNYSNNWDGQGSVSPNILLTKNDKISYIEGILYFSFSNYKLTPRKNVDFGTVTPVGISSNGIELVNDYALMQNYPNPFNPSTKINFNIPVSGNVTLKIYDMIGREVSQLVNSFVAAGSYSVNFDGSNLSSGIYFYKIEANNASGKNFVSTKRMVLVK